MSKVQIFKDYEEFITFIDDNNSNINGVSQEWLNKTGLTLETLNLVNCEQCWCCKDCEDCWWGSYLFGVKDYTLPDHYL